MDPNSRSCKSTIKKQCFPLYSLLLALGNPKVDYLSLDVEGTELDILRTIPWKKVVPSSRKNASLSHLAAVAVAQLVKRS